MTKKKQRLLCLALFSVLVFVHFLFDALCRIMVADEEKTLIRGLVTLHYLRNTGAAFGLLSTDPLLVNSLSGIFLITLTAWMLFGNMHTAARLSLSTVLAGGACNLYMRLVHGGVNDWIDLVFLRFPLFNFADICICLGALLFLVFHLFAKGQQTQ